MRRSCLREAGASVRDVVLPPQFAELVDAQIAIMVHEVARSLSHERLVAPREAERRDDRHDRRGPCGIAGALRRRAGIGAKKPLDAGSRFLPTSTSCLRRAPSARRRTGLQRPAIRCSIGCGRCCTRPACICRRAFGPHGLPVGITIVGPIGGDHATLLAADWIHARLGRSDSAAPT